jgi:ribosomal protein L11 methyltransferase
MSYPSVSEHPYRDLFIYYLSGKFRPASFFHPEYYVGNWEEGDFSFLFFTRPSLDVVKKAVDGMDGLTLLDHYHMSYAQWHGDEIVPIEIGKFTITPPWLAEGREIDPDTILLDPGVVFGTGTHPTTRDCLEALRLALADRSMCTAMDIGTGTGLLALAAAKMGCGKVLAMDLNYLAVRTAHKNIQLNHFTGQILAVQGDAEKFMDFTSDLVVSNIHFDVMKNLILTDGFLKKKRFILSGLMRDESRWIEAELSKLPVQINRKWNQDGIWHTFYGESETR